MSPAEDHLSSQFEILHPNRAVRIGERTFPAVHTSNHPKLANTQPLYEGTQSAVIPMENGQLVHIDHTPKLDPKFFAVPAGPGHKSFGSDDPTEVHKWLDEQSRLSLSPEDLKANKESLDYHVQMNREGR